MAIDPASWKFSDTLSIAAYRAGDWNTALEARGLGGGGPYDWLWRSMIYSQLGNKAEARQWYDKAVQRIENGPPPVHPKETIDALRQEAEQLLGITASATPPKDGEPQPETQQPNSDR